MGPSNSARFELVLPHPIQCLASFRAVKTVKNYEVEGTGGLHTLYRRPKR